MNSSTSSFNTVPSTTAPVGIPARARVALRLLERIEAGALRLHLPDGTALTFGAGDTFVDLYLHRWALFDRVMRSGDIGFAESWIDGDWTTPDLPGLIALFARNRNALDRAIYGTWWGRLAHVLTHWRHRNTRRGSRRNIHAHYDIGNPFYALWLDDGMTYSSALYDGEAHRTLADAQAAKFARALDAATAGRDDCEILEVGCGWGGLAEAAARRGHRVHGITLSTEQLEWARERIARAGLSQRARFELVDYRDVSGTYDAIVSIEMFEAVGQAWWPAYFRMLRERLRAGGRACVQAIVIDDALFDRYRTSSDFIQQYIFPGGMLPSRARFAEEAQRAGLRIVDAFAFGADYARTLAQWRSNFHARMNEVRALGFDQRFVRTWDFYLAYCEAGFTTGNTDVVQFTLARD